MMFSGRTWLNWSKYIFCEDAGMREALQFKKLGLA